MFDMKELVRLTLQDLGPEWQVRMREDGSINLVNSETGEIHIVVGGDEDGS